MSAGHLSHGMGREAVAPDWPPITDGEAAEVLRSWGRPPGRVVWRSPRPFSAGALVEGPDGTRVFVKRHHRRVRTAEALVIEHAFSSHLGAHGVPVAEVLAAPDATTVLAAGEWTYEVHRVAPGEDRYRDALSWTPYQCREDATGAGAALARFHRAAGGFDGPLRPAGVLVGGSRVAVAADPLDAIAQACRQRPDLGEWMRLRDWAAQIGPLLAGWPPAADEPGWGHGDWHPSNLTWDGTAVAGVIDLGLANRTGASFDLAVALERSVVGWLDLPSEAISVDRTGMAALLGGYRCERPVDAAAVVAALPLAHLDLALAEVEYFAGVVGSDDNATLAWEGYACGHLRWWGGPQGRRLLDDVQIAAGS